MLTFICTCTHGCYVAATWGMGWGGIGFTAGCGAATVKEIVWAAMPTLFHWDRDCCKPAAKTCSAANGGVTLFLQCFQCSGIQKSCKILLCTMFFSFLAVFPLPESYQNDPKFHFNTLLRSDTQKSSKNVENTTVFWSRCETVFGTPPAKADIATAILTNVIEHLVLLFCPPISTPSPPKRCGRIFS